MHADSGTEKKYDTIQITQIQKTSFNRFEGNN